MLKGIVSHIKHLPLVYWVDLTGGCKELVDAVVDVLGHEHDIIGLSLLAKPRQLVLVILFLDLGVSGQHLLEAQVGVVADTLLQELALVEN